MDNEAESWENNLHKPLPSSAREMRMIAFMRGGHSRFKFLLNVPRPKFFFAQCIIVTRHDCYHSRN